MVEKEVVLGRHSEKVLKSDIVYCPDAGGGYVFKTLLTVLWESGCGTSFLWEYKSGGGSLLITASPGGS